MWTAPLDGGRAWRLTADGVPVSSPRISPDGALVAWASRRDGAREIYVADVDGGGSTRLTWWGDHGADCAGWTPGGEVVAISAAGEATDRDWAFAVPSGGGNPRRLPYGPLTALALDASGTVATLSGGGMDAARWKRYRGGTAGRIWLDRGGAGEFVRVLSEIDGQLRSPMLVSSGGGATRLAFLSDHEGWGNLYSVDLDGRDLRRHTDHGADGAPAFYARQASTDGERVVFAAGGRLYRVDSLDAGSAPREIEIRLGGPRRAREPIRTGGRARPGRRRAGPHRPDQRRRRARHGAPPHAPGRPDPHAALRAGGAGAGGAAAGRGPCGLGGRRRGRGRGVRRADRPARRRRARAAAPVGRADRAGAGARGGARRVVGRAGHARRPVAGPASVRVRRVAGRHPARDRPGRDGRGGRPRVVPGQRVARVLGPGGAGPVAGSCLPVPRTGRSSRSRRPGSRTATRCSPPTGGTWRSCPAGCSTRATTSTRSTSRSRPAGSRSWCRWLRARRRRSGRAGRPPGVARGREAGGPAGPGAGRRRRRRRRRHGTTTSHRRPRARQRRRVGHGSATGPRSRPRGRGRTKPARGRRRARRDRRPRRRHPGGGGPLLPPDRRQGRAAVDAVPGGGTLGDSRADDEAEREKPWLERYDLAKRSLTTIADPCGGFAVSGDGTRVVTREGSTLRVLRADRSGSSAPQRVTRTSSRSTPSGSSSRSTRRPSGGRCSTRRRG